MVTNGSKGKLLDVKLTKEGVVKRLSSKGEAQSNGESSAQSSVESSSQNGGKSCTQSKSCILVRES